MSYAEHAKFNMIEQQIRPWEVLDNQVLGVIERLNREDFVAGPYRGLAYADCQIPIAAGVRMLPPTVEGRLLQALLLDRDDAVLEVGCGSGYLTACLASLAASVTSIDANAELLDIARTNVTAQGIDNVRFEQRALADLDASPSYDAIAVTGSLPAVPDNLSQALRPGGRLFVIHGHSPVMEAVLIRRINDDEWSRQSLFETDLPRLQQA